MLLVKNLRISHCWYFLCNIVQWRYSHYFFIFFNHQSLFLHFLWNTRYLKCIRGLSWQRHKREIINAIGFGFDSHPMNWYHFLAMVKKRIVEFYLSTRNTSIILLNSFFRKVGNGSVLMGTESLYSVRPSWRSGNRLVYCESYELDSHLGINWCNFFALFILQATINIYVKNLIKIY